MIYVTFSTSGAGSLRQALGIRDQRRKVVDLSDNLDWGPIIGEDFEARENWFNDKLPWKDGSWDRIANGAATFLRKLEDSDQHIVWVAPQNSAELCGLHLYLDHFGGERAEFILVNHGFPETWEEKPPKGLGELDVPQFKYLLAHENRQTWDAKRFPRDCWAKLCDSGTNLRIVQNGTATSVADDFFDVILLSQCDQQWRKFHRVMADAMISLWKQKHYVDDAFLTWRFLEMASQQKVEISREIYIDERFGAEAPLVRRL